MSAPQIIKLGAGIYTLSSGYGGSLDVTAPDLIIQGAGLGQTLINASGLGNRAFDVASGANLTLEGVRVEGGGATNQTSNGAPTSAQTHNGVGGGIYNDGTVTLIDSSITGNSASAGGGIYNSGTLTISDSEISNNSTSSGFEEGVSGGVANFGTLTVSNSTISGNEALTQGGINEGGGVFNSGTMSISDSTISGNEAGLNGGGVSNEGYATATISNSTISGNVVFPFEGNPVVANALITTEQGISWGGGGVFDSGQMTSVNSTISGNQAEYNPHFLAVPGPAYIGQGSLGGGIQIFDGPFSPPPVTKLYNTIVAGNLSPEGDPDIDGAVSSISANNLIGDGTGLSGISNGSKGNLVGQNPLLSSLGNYGGPTETMLLDPGSPAIAAGTTAVPGGLPLTDQSGLTRSLNGKVDIGAVEYQYDLGLTGYVQPGSGGRVEYAYSVTNNGPDPAGGVTLTLPLPQGTTFFSQAASAGWTESDPGQGNNGTVTFTHTGNLNSVQSAVIYMDVQLQNTTVGAYLTNTATVGPATSDNNPQNNSVTLTIANEQEGQAFNNTLLYHFTDPNLPNVPLVVVNSPTVSSSGGSLAASTYYYTVTSTTATGESMPSSKVSATTTGSTSAVTLSWSHVTGATGYKLYRGTARGAENTLIETITSGSTLSFTDHGTETTTPASPPTPKIFTASVAWGDNSGNSSSDGSGTASVVADPNGGFDVVGSHTYAEEGDYGASVVVTGVDGTTYSSGSITQSVQNVNLFKFFTSLPLGNLFAEVNWGDGSSGFGAIVSDPEGAGYYDVLGTHTYAALGNYTVSVVAVYHPSLNLFIQVAQGSTAVTYSGSDDAANNQQLLFDVADALLTAGALTPPPNATINQAIATFTDVTLYHFTDPSNQNATASNFTASVNWGDLSSNTSSDGSGHVSVVADPNGGFDIVGSHNYAKIGDYAISVAVTGTDGTTYSQTQSFQYGAKLFHFTDADPNGTPSDYTATVTWGDGKTNKSSDGTGTVEVVAGPSGGFDVYGLHTYTQLVNPGTFSVQVRDAGGASTSASDSDFKVLNPDKPLTAGALNVPSVTTEGQSINDNLLFQFTDPDSGAQASDYLAAVSWGDGTFNDSADGSNSVQVQKISTNPNGSIVFGVYGSHIYAPGSYVFGVKVTDEGDPRSATPDSDGQSISASSVTPLTIIDPAVVVKAGPTFTNIDTTLSSVQTLATFTDPGGPDSAPHAYEAIVQWGDGTVTVASLATRASFTSATVDSQGTITGQLDSVTNDGDIVLGDDGQTFSVNLAHQYANLGVYTITILLDHEGVLSPKVTTSAIIGQATPTVPTPTVPSNAIYNGQPQGATVGDVMGVNNADLGAPTLTYYAGTYTLATLPSSGGSSTAPTNAGNYTVVASYAGSTNYKAVSSLATYSIASAKISYTIGNDKQSYGSPASLAADLPPTINTGINGETLDIAYSSTGDTSTAAVGSYAITGVISNGSGLASNYIVTLTNGTLTVNPAQISYTIGNDTQIYASPANLAADLPASFNTGINGETLDLSYSSSGDTSTAAVGNYAITGTVSNGTGLTSNYTVTLTNGTLAVNPAQISYTIGNDTEAYGYPANLAADLPASFNTGINGESLNITYSSTGDTSTAQPGSYAITGKDSNGTGLASNYNVTLNPGTLTVLGSGASVVGSTLWIVGGTSTNDHVQIDPVGASNTGSTGVKVDANLNHVHTTTTYNQPFTALHILLYGGNDNIQLANTLTITATISAGNGNDNLQLDNGNNIVTLGNGNDNVQAGDGNNTITVGNGNDNVQLGNGDNTIATGNGNDKVQVGNGNNVIVTGNGNNNIQAGNSDNLIAAGLGHHNVQVGNGSNILIDGSVALTQSGDSLCQVLDDWIKNGAMASNVASIRSRLSVTFNTHYGNTLQAGSGLDWFWAIDTQDHLNNKKTDLLN
ncbi:MAG: beta strand repeat-containing protein [Gemmataceae bacterium]